MQIYDITHGPNEEGVADLENHDRCVGVETNSFMTEVITMHTKTINGFLIPSVILPHNPVKQPCHKMEAKIKSCFLVLLFIKK